MNIAEPKIYTPEYFARMIDRKNSPIFNYIKEKNDINSSITQITIGIEELESIYGVNNKNFFDGEINSCIDLFSIYNIFFKKEDIIQNSEFKGFILKVIQPKQQGSSVTITENIDFSIAGLLANFCADIEIFLLLENDQKTLRDKTFTNQEIKDQLHFSMRKYVHLLRNLGVNTEKVIS